ncbi:MAG: GABA permease, partial [Pseudomonas sp.]|nr:GABA permease [Pseudomonas sp.]
SLGARGQALPMTRRISGSGVPTVAVILSTLAGFAGCLVNYVFPGKVFGFLLSTTGAIALLVYLVIAVSQLRMRARAEREGRPLELKMWLFPWLTWLVIATIVLVLGYMLVSDAYRYETLMTAGVTTFILVVALARRPGKASLQTA